MYPAVGHTFLASIASPNCKQVLADSLLRLLEVTHLHVLARNHHCGFTLAHMCQSTSHVTLLLTEYGFCNTLCHFQTGHKDNGTTISNLVLFLLSISHPFVLRLAESFCISTKNITLETHYHSVVIDKFFSSLFSRYNVVAGPLNAQHLSR